MTDRLPASRSWCFDRRARAPQPRHGGALGCRHSRRVPRRRRRVEGRAARRRARRSPSSARRSLPLTAWADRLALVYAALVPLYWLLPQSWLDGEATQRGQLFAARHHLIPVAAYFSRAPPRSHAVVWRRVSLVLAGVGVALAAWGIVDAYLVPLQWWRDSGVPGWFEEQLGLVVPRALRPAGELGAEHGRRGQPDQAGSCRRSSARSPRRYVLVIVLLFLVARRRTWWTVAAAAVAYAGLLWTHTRAAYLALAVGLVVLAVAQRRLLPVAPRRRLPSSSAWRSSRRFPTSGRRRATPGRSSRSSGRRAGSTPDVSRRPLSAGDASTSSHLRNLRDGIRVVVRHPQGYGLGNAGVNASRTHVRIKAGESTYTEMGVDTGLVGLRSCSAPGSVRCSSGCGGARPGSAPPGCRCSRSGSRAT